MNKVITINLNGRAYQLEESGYAVLRQYLEQAAAKLGENPDKDEIMADLEQAIADKCGNFLNSHKTVVTEKEVELVIKEMGPVDDMKENKEGEEKDEKKSEKSSDKNTPKRLYQIREGAVFTGVCNGIAAYFNMDVTLVRVIFVILTILTHGAWIAVYVIMAIVTPYANTSEQKAEAHGLPFNANELIERAREKYAHFDKKYWENQGDKWKKWGEEQEKHWKDWGKQKEAHLRKWSKEKEENKWKSENFKKYRPQSYNGSMNFGAGIAFAILGIAMAFISLLWVIAVLSILATGALFGFVFFGIPVWLIILLLTCAYNIILLPLRSIKSAAFRNSNIQGYQDDGWFGILDTIMWFTIIGLFCYAVWMYVPGAHFVWERSSEFIQQNFDKWQHGTQQVTQQM